MGILGIEPHPLHGEISSLEVGQLLPHPSQQKGKSKRGKVLPKLWIRHYYSVNRMYMGEALTWQGGLKYGAKYSNQEMCICVITLKVATFKLQS